MTPELTRYALYFSPAPGSPLWHAGSHWLGRDPLTNATLAQPSVRGVPPLMVERLTRDARRYGLHATLKSPFHLANGFSEAHLERMAAAFVRGEKPIALDNVRVRPLGSFLALRPDGPHDALGELAMRCVSHFDNLRAAPGAAELARRRRLGLTQRQEALLQRWGYPYTEEEFRFHMTLTDSLDEVDEDAAYALRKAAEDCFASAVTENPVIVDALSVFRQDEPGAPLTLWKRFPFGDAGDASIVPPGRLFFVVGPSGAGKDSLLRWVQEHIPAGAELVFARRTITRSAHPSEEHEVVEQDDFWRLASAGFFSMIWQANGLCYGIRRGIEADLKAGCNVVINGSREFIPKLHQSFPDAQVIWVDADDAQIRQRIEARQREHGAALLRRMERITQFEPPEDANLIRLDNSGPIDVAGKRLLEIVSRP